MKQFKWWCFTFLALSLSARASINIPGADGSDGTLSVAGQDLVIDLSQAVTGNWNDDNTANTGSGIYDSNKWAVVFKYSSVNIDAASTVIFSNHPSRAPVVWLVDGDVTIDGVVSLNGQQYVSPPDLAEPGPGGFRGGMGYYAANVGASAGFGPGGGTVDGAGRGYAASHGNTVSQSPDTYGNPSLVPLLGGSGGAGAASGTNVGGGAGGGAILIACSGTLTINGTVRANGGSGYQRGYSDRDSGGGSGGGIRLVGNAFLGSGIVEAKGGEGSDYPGALGRIRLERVYNSNSWTVIAPSPSVVGLTTNDTAVLWPTATAPTVKIVSIGGEPVSGDPLASFGTYGADVALPETNTVEVVVETSYVEEASEVNIRLTPRSNATYTEVSAATNQVISTDPLVLHWTADIPVSAGYSAIQVHVVRP